MPSVNKEVGSLLHSFIGRDHLNICFDDVVSIGELEVYVNLNAK